MSEDSESNGSEYVPSEDDLEVGRALSKSDKVRKAKPITRSSKKKATTSVVASPRRQLSERKRQSSRISPPPEKKVAPVAKKQRTQAAVVPKLSDEGKEAVQRVDAEVFRLPSERRLNFSVMEQQPGMAFAFRSSEKPEGHGTKIVPQGHPESLAGKTFVISGMLESLTREEAEHVIKRHGGRVTSAVSGKTTFLLVGKDCGRTKLDKARQLETKLIDEDGLFQLIRAADIAYFRTPADEPASEKSIRIPSGVADQGGSSQRLEDETMGQELWVDKYKPQSLSEIVGNVSLVNSLSDWLQNWYGCRIIDDTAPAAPVSRSKLSSSINGKKAVLLSGPPGIGKTTAALLVAKELEFDAIEVNASDTRNKADKTGKGGIAGKRPNQIKALCQNARMVDPSTTEQSSTVLIMDEVDGMSGGDRGGMTDLIENIKNTKIPIICICNDKYNRKLASLRNHCFEFDFRRPNKMQISKRVKAICARERLMFENDMALEALIDQAHGDLRTIIGGLQVIRATTQLVRYTDIETGKVSIQKEHDINPFEAARSLLSGESKSKKWYELSSIVFNDLDLIPLLVQENYVNHMPDGYKTMKERLKKMAKAARFLSLGDRINTAVRSRQKWSLLPSAVDMGTLVPAAIVRGRREVFSSHEMNFTRFTGFLGNLSKTNKQLRLLQTMATRMSSVQKYSIDTEAAVLDYFPLLRSLLTLPLVEQHAEGIPEVFELMNAYCIDKEHYDYIMDVTQFKGSKKWAENILTKIPAKVKTALTRQVNAAHISCSALPSEEGAVKRVVKTEESPEEAYNPESSVIQEKIKQEVKEEGTETVDVEDMTEKMKESGYQLKLITEKSNKRSLLKPSQGRDSKRASSGRGRGSRGRAKK